MINNPSVLPQPIPIFFQPRCFPHCHASFILSPYVWYMVYSTSTRICLTAQTMASTLIEVLILEYFFSMWFITFVNIWIVYLLFLLLDCKLLDETMSVLFSILYLLAPGDMVNFLIQWLPNNIGMHELLIGIINVRRYSNIWILQGRKCSNLKLFKTQCIGQFHQLKMKVGMWPYESLRMILLAKVKRLAGK